MILNPVMVKLPHHKPAILASSPYHNLSTIVLRPSRQPANYLTDTKQQATTMSSYADNYGLPASFTTIALFGANGQIGDRSLYGLISNKRKNLKIHAHVFPWI